MFNIILFINAIALLISVFFLSIAWKCLKKVLLDDCVKGFFMKNKAFVPDWDNNDCYLFYATNIVTKGHDQIPSLKKSCRIDNALNFISKNKTYCIDTKYINELQLKPYYKGILPANLKQTIELIKKININMNNRTAICGELQSIYNNTKDRIKRPLLIWGFFGYAVSEWKLKDGDAGFIKLDKRSSVESIYDQYSLYLSKVFFLFWTLVFCVLFLSTGWGVFINMMSLFLKGGG